MSSTPGYIVEFYSHEGEFHWEETGRFDNEEAAMAHYNMKRRQFPKSRWCVSKVEILAVTNPVK